MIKWIFFDAMGVIFTTGNDTDELLVPFIQERNPLITRDEIREIYLRASLGRITSNQFWKKANVCKTGDEQTTCREYLDTCLQLDESFIPVAGHLKKEYHLALLSNDVSEWSAYLRKKFKLEDLLEFSIISGDVKCRKPDAEIYKLAVRRAGVDLAECVFVDDRDGNLASARKQGIKAVRFLRDDKMMSLAGVPAVSGFWELETVLQSYC